MEVEENKPQEEEQPIKLPNVGNKNLTIGASIIAVLMGGSTSFFTVWGELTTLEDRMDKRYKRLHDYDDYLMRHIEEHEELLNELENQLIRLEAQSE